MNTAAAIQGLTLYATAGDMTAALQALYAQAMDGDTITLRPMNGVKRFYHSTPLDWTGTKSVSVDMTGCELYYQGPLTGTQASVTWGGSAGVSVTNVRWTSGNILGTLVVQNLNYVKDFVLAGASTIIIQAKGTSCSYNDFRIGSLTGAAGNGSALIFNQVNAGDWTNCNDIIGCSMHGTAVGGVMQPTIWQVNQAATFAPSAGAFTRCRFEGDGQVLFNVGKGFNAILDSVYAEGTWTQGLGGGSESFTWVNMPAKWAPWLADPRNIATGVLQ